MLTIRKEQMDALEQAAFERYVANISQHLRRRYPSRLSHLSDAGLRALVYEGIERAQSFQVQDQGDIKRYLEHCANYGEYLGDSDRTAWAQVILRSDRTGTEKMDRIDDYTFYVLALGKSDSELQ